MVIKKFIKDLSEEQNGFEFAEPKRLSEKKLLVAVPVLNNSEKSRDYITISEAKDIKIEDTGEIDFIYIKNNEPFKLYIGRGEIFAGKTQERAVVHSHIIEPNKGMRVPVRCVNQSKPIQANTTMEYSINTVPYSVDLSKQSNTWSSITPDGVEFEYIYPHVV